MGDPAPSATRDRVRLAAARVFAERGYAGAAMAEIVLGSGMTRGAVYFHFESKADLAVSLVEQAYADWRSLLADAAAQGEQGVPGLGVVFERLGDLLGRDPVSRAAVRLEHDAGLLPPDVHSPLALLRTDAARRLRQAQLLGRLRDDVHPTRHAAVLVASFVGVHEHGAAGGGDPAAQRFRSQSSARIAAWWDLVSRGLDRP